MPYEKPLPPISPTNQPHWDTAKQKREFHIQKCQNCNKFWWPVGPVCPDCHERNFKWEKVSGKGKINSWVVFHQRYFPGFEKELPYNVCEIELDEGPRVMTNLINVKNEEIKLGMPV